MSCSWLAWRRVPSVRRPHQPRRSLSNRRRQVLLRIAEPIFSRLLGLRFHTLPQSAVLFVTARETGEVYGNRELLSIKIIRCKQSSCLEAKKTIRIIGEDFLLR